jgi:seryl-tRNA synthetase
VNEIKDKRDRLVKKLGNLVHESVPISQDEAENTVIKTHGKPITDRILLPHYDLLPKLGLNLPKGSLVAGHRGYYLTGPVAQLQLALMNYSLQFLIKKGYTPVIPPYLMNLDMMEKVAQLEQFNEEL